MKYIYKSPLAMSLVQVVPERLKAHSYTIIGLAQEVAQEIECPLCEVLDPMSEALAELVARHQIRFDRSQKQIVLA
ncbi:MAG: hypothetical protein ACFBSF_21290 [Leptolyngbyaceae cyanobacterium]